jgi:hypothetical protein
MIPFDLVPPRVDAADDLPFEDVLLPPELLEVDDDFPAVDRDVVFEALRPLFAPEEREAVPLPAVELFDFIDPLDADLEPPDDRAEVLFFADELFDDLAVDREDADLDVEEDLLRAPEDFDLDPPDLELVPEDIDFDAPDLEPAPEDVDFDPPDLEPAPEDVDFDPPDLELVPVDLDFDPPDLDAADFEEPVREVEDFLVVAMMFLRVIDLGFENVREAFLQTMCL